MQYLRKPDPHAVVQLQLLHRFDVWHGGQSGKEQHYRARVCRDRYRSDQDTKLTEKLSLQFKAEMFNVLNHPNFATPSGTIINAGLTPSYSPAGAQITALVGSGGIPDVARQTQFSLKLIF
jgi:hypothetical protein